MTTRFVCIHGHFYQPPRENPGLERIEPQPSAAPYRDWNERITAECYAPNARARLLDSEGRLRELQNNYEWLSFDFGPTLMTWLERNAKHVHDAVIAGDSASAARLDGHGGALAHPYHHSILPLSNPMDRRTEIFWGLFDFAARFGRKAEGMWLPETAVDVATLDEISKAGISFTVLAPRQARRVRKAGSTAWREIEGEDVDTTRAYRVLLPSGRSIAVFFYDGALSQAVAFERVLDSADRMVERILERFDPKSGEPQLVSIATDGETYGHHHRFGEMALARAIELLRGRSDVEVTNYAAFLAKRPPTDDVEIVAPSAWSCAHGVERWRSNCGCRVGGESSQAWRAPLRSALEALREAAASNFDTTLSVLLRDPVAARDEFIAVVRDRSRANVSAFVERHAARTLSVAERITVLELLEAERQCLAMFTSCAFFFDDLAGIETMQVMSHADRAIELIERAIGLDLTAVFAPPLALARSNDSSKGDGAKLFFSQVRPHRGDLVRIGKHAAMIALREPQPRFDTAGHGIERLECAGLAANGAELAYGTVRVECSYSGRTVEVSHAVIEMGRLLFAGAVRMARANDDEALRRIEMAFSRSLTEGLAALAAEMPAMNCDLEWVLPDSRESFIEQAFRKDLTELAAIEKRIADGCARVVERLDSLGVALPEALERVRSAREAQALRVALDESKDLRAALEHLRRKGDLEDAGSRRGVGARLVKRVASEVAAAFAVEDGGDRVRSATELVRALFAWRHDFGLHELQESLLLAMRPRIGRCRELAERDAVAATRLAAWQDLSTLLRVV